MSAPEPPIPDLSTRELDAPTLQFLRRAQEGDPDAFTHLYERVAPALYAYANLRNLQSFGGRLEVEEVLQEVWLRAWRNLAKFEVGAGSMRGWLIRVTQHVLLENSRFRRRHGQALPRSDDDEADPAQEIVDPATSVTRRIARDDALRTFLDHVGGLEPTDRLLVLHCGIEGWSCAEAARRLELSHETLRKRWQRLRQKLLLLPGVERLLL